MIGLRAAHLNQQVVITGGEDGWGNYRYEVLCGILWLVSCFCLQVLQYNVDGRGAWTEMDGKMREGRSAHAIVEANLGAVCFGIGNLNPNKTIKDWRWRYSTTELLKDLVHMTDDQIERFEHYRNWRKRKFIWLSSDFPWATNALPWPSNDLP